MLVWLFVDVILSVARMAESYQLQAIATKYYISKSAVCSTGQESVNSSKLFKLHCEPVRQFSESIRTE